MSLCNTNLWQVFNKMSEYYVGLRCMLLLDQTTLGKKQSIGAFSPLSADQAFNGLAVKKQWWNRWGQKGNEASCAFPRMGIKLCLDICCTQGWFYPLGVIWLGKARKWDVAKWACTMCILQHLCPVVWVKIWRSCSYRAVSHSLISKKRNLLIKGGENCWVWSFVMTFHTFSLKQHRLFPG